MKHDDYTPEEKALDASVILLTLALIMIAGMVWAVIESLRGAL